MRFIFKSIVTLGLIGLVLFGAYVWLVTRNLPDIDKVVREGVNPSKYTQVFAEDGTPIFSYERFRHKDVPLAQVSPHFTDALLATEDRRFYQHMGVDPVAIGRAMVRDILHGGIREGGSTLTQQLARNVFLSDERSMNRKIREMALAIKLERVLSKQQILELYVNNIYFGEGAYGIDAASEIYFNKKPADLSVTEAALLAGLPQAPSAYSPFQNMRLAKERRDEVLGNLHEVGKISEAELKKLRAQPIRINPNGQSIATANRAPYFNRYVMEKVCDYLGLDEQTFWQSGLKIYTTLDINLQKYAENAIATESAAFSRTHPQQEAALVSINPKTGGILAYVGGKNYSESQFDRVSKAVRSPGSLFKVFTYTTAIDKGYEPTRVYLDEPIKSGDWEPHNFDNTHHGYMTMARALIESDNIVAVKVLNSVGPDNVIITAQRMGITSPLNPYLALTLGGSNVTLLEVTSAIGVLANQGVRAEPFAITKVLDNNSRILYQHFAVQQDVLSRPTVDTMVAIMQQVVKRGTGHAADLGARDVAGKTGTSDDERDAWFVGYTPDVVTGVWAGNDDNSPMGWIAGGTMPAATWKATMAPWFANKPVHKFDLTYAKPLTEADIFNANIKNQDPGDVNNPLATGESVKTQDAQLDTSDQPPVPGTNPDGTPATGPNGAPLPPGTQTPPSAQQPANPMQPQQPPASPAPPANPAAASPEETIPLRKNAGYPGVILKHENEPAGSTAGSSKSSQ